MGGVIWMMDACGVVGDLGVVVGQGERKNQSIREKMPVGFSGLQ